MSPARTRPNETALTGMRDTPLSNAGEEDEGREGDAVGGIRDEGELLMPMDEAPVDDFGVRTGRLPLVETIRMLNPSVAVAPLPSLVMLSVLPAVPVPYLPPTPAPTPFALEVLICLPFLVFD